jgi:hypothetical protein
MTIKMFLQGYRTAHRLYMIFGKSRETSYAQSLAAVMRWSQNTGEYWLSRYIERAQPEGKVKY